MTPFVPAPTCRHLQALGGTTNFTTALSIPPWTVPCKRLRASPPAVRPTVQRRLAAHEKRESQHSALRGWSSATGVPSLLWLVD